MSKTSEQLGKLRILLLASFVVGLLFFGSYVLTVSAETKHAGPLEINYDGDKLFEELNIAPGFEKVKTLSVKNNGSIPHSFAIAVEGVSGDLADVIMILPKMSGVPLWSDGMSLSELATLPGGSQTVLASINPGETKLVDLVAYLPTAVGNKYQGKSTSTFSFVVGDQEPEPSPPASPSPSPSPGGTGGGTTLGGGLALGTGETLGVSVSPSPSPSASPDEEEGKVEGEEDVETKGTSYQFLYWLIPLLVIILLLLFFWWRRRRRDEEETENL